MEVPTPLVVTNDFPPRVGGIQRTLEALVRALPGDRVGVFCPTADGASGYDAEAPFAHDAGEIGPAAAWVLRGHLAEPAADLSLLQLDRVPGSMRAAKMGDSGTVRVGDQVIVIGAPYGLTYSMSVGWISA